MRVDLHGRRVGGWVVALGGGQPTRSTSERLKPILKVTGAGPSAEIIELAEWASVRWAANRIRPFLVTASPMRAIAGTPARVASVDAGPRSDLAGDDGHARASDGGVLRLPPRADVMPTVLSAVAFARRRHRIGARDRSRSEPGRAAGHPAGARRSHGGDGAERLGGGAGWRRRGDRIGARRPGRPVRGLAAAVVLDEHDEALQEERSPTWHARDVLAERCRRAGVPLVLVSPVPTLTAVVDVRRSAAASSIHRRRASGPAGRR